MIVAVVINSEVVIARLVVLAPEAKMLNFGEKVQGSSVIGMGMNMDCGLKSKLLFFLLL